MEDLGFKILKEFGVRAQSCAKIKYSHICQVEDGVIATGKTNMPHEKILFAHAVKEHLFANDFEGVDRFLTTPQGVPYATIYGETYVASYYVQTRDANFSCADEFLSILKTVATMHFKLGEVSLPKHPQLSNDKLLLEDYFAKKIKDLKKYKKLATGKGNLSNFDVLLVKNFQSILETSCAAIELLQQVDYMGILTSAKSQVCHNSLKEETIRVDDSGQMRIVGFDNAAPGHALFDLSALIHRHFKKKSEKVLPLKAVLNTYTQTNPLNRAELALLEAVLIFPAKIYELCEKHYTKKRAWESAAMVDRLQREMDVWAEYLAYVKECFSGKS